jgi:predicted ATPase
MARLSATARNVVEVGAVLGQRFTLACLCQVANSSEHEALTILDELVRYRLLCEEEQTADGATSHYSFAYSKIREFVYAEIGDARRRIFHPRALQALQIAQAPPAALALHARAAGFAEPATEPAPAGQNDTSLAGWWPPLATYAEMLTLALKTQEPAAKMKAFNRLVSLVAQQVFNAQDWEGYPL